MNMLRAGNDYVWLVVGPFCWGKGETAKAAMKRAKENGNKENVQKNHAVYLAPPSVYLDEMGGIYWKKEEGKPDNVILLKLVKGGLEINPLPE